MAAINNSSRVRDQSSVKMSVTPSSNVISEDHHGDTSSREPARRRIASLDCIRKHLGYKNQVQPCATLVNKGCSSSEGNGRYPPIQNACESSSKLSEENFQQDDDELLVDTDLTLMLEKHSLPTRFGKRCVSRPSNRKSISKKIGSCTATIEPFDICWSETEEFAISHCETQDSLFLPRQRLLRQGMVLLKSFLSQSEQVVIVSTCRELGLGPGGFYQPGYYGGAKLRLHMMCLGLDWDPQTRKYQKQRRIDRSKPPDIPQEFHQLVNRAMQDSHALIRRDSKVCNAEEILPLMSPDICIVNFYSETGRLGLHRDRDESVESLTKGLPVVSFSVGDSAEFLYGDQRDPNKAEKVVLQSGDVLIFGCESRHVFHGIASIVPNTAPKFLVDETRLCPGRLNLTFRQY